MFNKLIAILILLPFALKAEGLNKHRADTHAPIGVMGEHSHSQNDFMISYRYMYTEMEPNYKGNKKVKSDEILLPNGDFIVSPLSMTMEMHILGFMYAPLDQLTLMLMIPYTIKKMEHKIAAPIVSMRADLKENTFTTQSAGLGDISLSFLSPFFTYSSQKAIFKLGLGFPTGSIDEGDKILSEPSAGLKAIREDTLPYPMQLGKGNYAIAPALTYKIQGKILSFGLQTGGDFSLHRNKQGYQIGNSYMTTSWLSFLIFPELSTSARLTWKKWDNIKGKDTRLNPFGPTGSLGPRSVPTTQTDLRSGQHLKFLLGFNLYTQRGLGVDQRLAIEIGTPLYQELQGPQLGLDPLSLTVGWQSSLF